MISIGKKSLAVFILSAGLATGAFAQQAANSAVGAGKNHPCKSQHEQVMSACAADKCSAGCKAAHKAMKACREQNGLPMHQGGKGGGHNPCPHTGNGGNHASTGATTSPSAVVR